ncbi:hypothetical protein [Candidatus Formimonas warabiya]|nr:hypothetical protein [Candidatus Formimonas warabiya]
MKRVCLVVIGVLLAALLAGCTGDSLESYKKAVQKTEEITKGQVSGDFTLALDFDLTGLEEAQIKDLEYFKNIKGSFQATYDREAEKTICRNYLNLNGLGFDTDFYRNGREMFIKMPIAGKYIRLDEMMEGKETKPPGTAEFDFVSPETGDTLHQTWLALIRQEDVFTGKSMILTTPDGEVKTTRYGIKLTDAQIKALINDTFAALSGDEKLKSNFDRLIEQNFASQDEITFDRLSGEIKKSLASCRIENFQYDAYVDIDGYIVNEIISFEAKFTPDQAGGVTGIRYRLETKNWDINQEQEFKFPVLTKENTLDPEEMDRNLPFVFKDLFQKKS